MLLALVIYAILWNGVALRNIISRGKPTSWSSALWGTSGSAAVDGKYNQYMRAFPNDNKQFTNCFHSNKDANPFLMIDLQGQFSIDHVVLYNRMDEVPQRIIGAVVELLDKNGRVVHECGRITDYKSVYNIPCAQKMAAKVRVRGAPYEFLQICELDVIERSKERCNICASDFVPLNPISRGKPTTWSSVLWGTSGSDAVDGKYNQYMRARPKDTKQFKNCFHTDNDANPFLIVDLQGQFSIDHVVLYHRLDEVPERIIGAVVELLDKNGKVIHVCGRITDYKSEYNIPCAQKMAAKVRVRGAPNAFLQICELDVIEACQPRCWQPCNLAQSFQCSMEKAFSYIIGTPKTNEIN